MSYCNRAETLKSEENKPVFVGLAVIIIVILTFPHVYPTVQGQIEQETVFTPAYKFETTNYNSSIRFAVNGSCSEVSLENGVWTFTNLRLNNSQAFNNFSIAARDSNITIYSVRTGDSNRSSFLRYNAQGEGNQTVNLYPGSTRQTHWSEWSVTVPRSGTVWLPEGENWKLHGNSVFVWGLTGNISVVRYNFSPSYRDSNLPLHLQHSITIITAVALAAVAATALIIQIITRRR
jgi:hypothetical protein